MLPDIWNQPLNASSLQGGSATRLQNTASGQDLQPTAQPIGTLGGGGGGGGGNAPPGGDNLGGGSLYTSPGAPVGGDIANLKEEIMSRRSRANSIFEALTDAVTSLAKERRGQIEGQYKEQSNRAVEDFTDKGDELRRVYAARGLADSSFRVMGEDRAGRDYSRALTDLGSQRSTGLAQVGQEAVGQRARIGADRESLNDFNLDEIGDDEQALTSLRDTLDKRIREAQIKKAELNTAEGFRGKLDKIAPYTGVNKVLKASLSSLVGLATPKVVKDRIAGALIKNYASEDFDYWNEYYQDEDAKATSSTSVA